MKKFLFVFVLGFLLLSACGAGEVIEVHDPWARPALQGENSAVYFLLHNHSPEDDELTGVSSDIAEIVEIHESIMDANGVMQMTPIASLPLPSDAEVEFAPGGLHVMLVGLTQDLKVGAEFQIVLHFENQGDLTVTVSVEEGEGESSHQDMP